MTKSVVTTAAKRRIIIQGKVNEQVSQTDASAGFCLLQIGHIFGSAITTAGAGDAGGAGIPGGGGGAGIPDSAGGAGASIGGLGGAGGAGDAGIPGGGGGGGAGASIGGLGGAGGSGGAGIPGGGGGGGGKESPAKESSRSAPSPDVLTEPSIAIISSIPVSPSDSAATSTSVGSSSAKPTNWSSTEPES